VERDENVFDFQALLYPDTVFALPKDVVPHPDLTMAEKRHPCLLGFPSEQLAHFKLLQGL
jgi:hypothetical protein